MTNEPAADMYPSHNISEDGSKVTIHDLELFVGHIPGFDSGDSDIEDFDSDTIEQIIERTKQHMSAGCNPKLVMLHQDDNNSAPSEALGDIVSIERKDINIRTDSGEVYSGPGIIGDVVMAKDDFDSYVASNRFPRRSAEIWSDGQMSEVALLGRETPARPLRDTRFTKAGTKSTYTRPVTFEQVSPGGGNTFVPTLGEEKKEHEMPEQDEMMPATEGGADNELVNKLKAENEELRGELEELKMQMASDEGVMEDAEKAEYEEDEMDDEKEMRRYEEKEDDKEDKEIFSRIRKTKNGKEFLAKFKRIKEQRNAFRNTARKLGIELRKAEFGKILDNLASDGYRVAKHRDHMISELLSTKDVEGKLTFWRSTLTKDPIGRRLDLTGSKVQGKSEYTAFDRKNASDRAVARMTKEGLSADQFQQVFDEEIKAG